VRPFVRSKNSTYVNRYKPISKLPRASKTTIDIITAVCSHSITRHSPQMEPDSVASDSCTNSLMALRSEGRVICESFAMSSVRSIMHRPLTQAIANGVSHCLLPLTIYVGLSFPGSRQRYSGIKLIKRRLQQFRKSLRSRSDVRYIFLVVPNKAITPSPPPLSSYGV
jgi:hypothetical protein